MVTVVQISESLSTRKLRQIYKLGSILWNGKSCFLFQKWISSDVIKLYTDAAGVHGGFAAILGSKWFVGEWPPDMKDLHITIKELYHKVLALEIWGKTLENHKVLFMTDTEAVVGIINSTTSKDKVLMKLVRRFVSASTSAAAESVTQTVIQHMGRWKSNAFKNYIRMNNF